MMLNLVPGLIHYGYYVSERNIYSIVDSKSKCKERASRALRLGVLWHEGVP